MINGPAFEEYDYKFGPHSEKDKIEGQIALNEYFIQPSVPWNIHDFLKDMRQALELSNKNQKKVKSVKIQCDFCSSSAPINEIIETAVSFQDEEQGLKQLIFDKFPPKQQLRLKLDEYVLSRLIENSQQLERIEMNRMSDIHEPARLALINAFEAIVRQNFDKILKLNFINFTNSA